MEVLGAVSSAVALAEIVAKSVLTTKKLWEEARGVPEEINQLMNDLAHLTPMIGEAEAIFNDQVQNPSTDTALLLIHNYKDVSGKLHLLAADLNQRIVTAKRGKRNLTKLRATLSKTLIQRYQRELDSISQTLSFFFNVHNLHSQKESQALHLESITLHRNTDDKIEQLLSLFQSHLLPQTMHDSQFSPPEKDPNNPSGGSVSNAVDLSNKKDITDTETRQNGQKPNPIAWRRPRVLGGYIYQTSDHPEKPGTKVFQVRLQLPWCLSGKAWDFEAYSSSMGWNMSIRPWTTRPNGDQIFKLVQKGSWPEIIEQLNSGRASILDRNEFGHSLLGIALQWKQLEIARNLMRIGFDIEGSGLEESVHCMFSYGAPPAEDALSWFQFAAELGLLETISENIFDPRNEPEVALFNVSSFVWRNPELLSLFVRERTAIHGGVSIFELFRTLVWTFTDPRLFLELCRSKNIGPQLFRESIMKVTWAPTMANFADAYFTFAPERDVLHANRHFDTSYDETYFDDWRELAGWLLTDISMDELVWQPSESFVSFASSHFLDSLRNGLRHPGFRHESKSSMRSNKRRLTWNMISWLEDVQGSGLDLSEYGRRQLARHKSSHSSFTRWWQLSMVQARDRVWLYGPRLMSFTFGPRPQDWGLIWDADVEEFAGDFWELTENPPLHIPGTYPEDNY